MTAKLILGAVAVTAALAIGAPAFADDMAKPAKPAKTMHHRAAKHHAAPMQEGAAKPREQAMHHRGKRHDMSQDAKEREETMRLNQEQLHKAGM